MCSSFQLPREQLPEPERKDPHAGLFRQASWQRPLQPPEHRGEHVASTWAVQPAQIQEHEQLSPGPNVGVGGGVPSRILRVKGPASLWKPSTTMTMLCSAASVSTNCDVVPGPLSSSHASSIPEQRLPSNTYSTVSREEPEVSIVYEPRRGARYTKVASGAPCPPQLPERALLPPTVEPVTVIGALLPRSRSGQATSTGVGVAVGVDVTVGRSVADGVHAAMRVLVAVGVRVAVAVAVAVGKGVGGCTPQPYNALLTAVRISSIVIWPSRLASPAVHVAAPALPRAMFTIVSSSSMVTERSLLQSPVHAWVGVAVGV